MSTILLYVFLLLLLLMILALLSFINYTLSNTDFSGCNQALTNEIANYKQYSIYTIIAVAVLTAIVIGIGVYNLTVNRSSYRRLY